MSNILKSEVQTFPSFKLIGLSARVKPLSPEIPELWDKAMKMDLFDTLHGLPGLQSEDLWGAEYDMEQDSFTYLVSMKFDVSTPCPEGLECIEFPQMKVLHTQVKGPSNRIYGDTYPLSVEEAKRLGHELDFEKNFCAEVYTQAFHESQKQGNEWILDHVLPIL